MLKLLETLVVLLIALELASPAGAQDIQLFEGDEDALDAAIVGIAGGVAVFAGVMTIHNRHHLIQDNPSTAGGSIGLLSSLLSTGVGIVFLAAGLDESAGGAIAVGSGLIALGLLDGYFSVRNFQGPSGHSQETGGIDVSFRPILASLGEKPLSPGILVELRF